VQGDEGVEGERYVRVEGRRSGWREKINRWKSVFRGKEGWKHSVQDSGNTESSYSICRRVVSFLYTG
jgi:hypothetical protein